jgi:hypothetical protein
MTISEDAEGLLDALYAMNQELGKRPSIQQAKLSFFPEWDKHRLFEAAKALDAAGDILNLTGAMMNVDLSSTAQKRAKARTLPPQNPATTIHIGENYNSPIQQISAGAHGTQATTYTITNSQLRAAIDTYKKHADELSLDPGARRRADAQIATIEAQLQDEPDPTIVKSAGKSLKKIIEGAIGGAAGNVLANPSVWASLLSLFN